MALEISRRTYASVYGPSVGDRVRLADTSLVVQVERDETSYGDELLGGWGKTMRDGMLVTSRHASDSELDVLISNALVIDPIQGVLKANIGIKEGRIVEIGTAGNPDVVENLDLVVGAHTSLIPAEGLIATPGAVDSHVHLSSPAVLGVALSSGITTIVGMGSGGTWDVGVNPEANLLRMLDAWRQIPLNVALLARGSVLSAKVLERSLVAGASGFKIHEDFGGYPAVIESCLEVAEHADVAVAMHTDSLNESAFLEETLQAIGGRTVHAYHVEGSGGGHVPNILEIVSEPHVIPSSTTPTLPYAIHTAEEIVPMTMIVHRQSRLLDTDVHSTRARVRGATIQAESILQDRGAISIIASDATGMGRIGELVRRTWQLADRMKQENDATQAIDNARVLRYIAKYTINPAITHGLAASVGSLEPGKLADVVLWHPAYFGAKPEMVIKAGFIAWAARGDGSGSTRVGQPRSYLPMFGGLGDAPSALATIFASRWAVDDGLRGRLRGRRHVEAVAATRGLTRRDMVGNQETPTVEVPADGSPVLIDRRPATLDPVANVPLGQLFHIA